MNPLRRLWTRWTQPQRTGVELTLRPGETQSFTAYVPEAFLDKATFVAHWTCGGCKQKLRRDMPARTAHEYGVCIACPYCEPDNLYSRGVVLDRPTTERNRPNA